MRLDKYLAHAGSGTRKEVKLLIRKGCVRVNDEICKKDDMHIDEEVDRVFLHDEEVFYQKYYYIMLNKPVDVVSAVSDPVHETVLDLIELPVTGLFPVGRLDIDTEGLLLITNDGNLSHALLSPKKHVAKRYLVHIDHPLSQEDIHRLEDGVIELDEERILPAKVDVVEPCILYLTIEQGKFHQIKRMLHAVQNEVTALKRIQMGPLLLDEQLEVGEWRHLSEEELASLKDPIQ